MLRKFAAFEVLEATLAPANDPLGLQRYAHRHQFTYEPRPGYLYVRSRAISSRTNDNFDTFPAEEIKKSYLTFIGKPVFVNHNNDNHRRARGVIIDAVLHEDRNPDGSPDVWSEVLMEVDAVRFPKLAKAILDGHIDRTSMGTDVAYSICSFCGNKATTPLEYCQHIPKMKGKRIYRTQAGTGKKEGVLVSEICHGLKFFENSLLVEEPADPTAFFTGVEDHSGLGKAASKTAAPYDPELASRQQAHWDKKKDYRERGLCDCNGSMKVEPHAPAEHSDWATRNHAAGKTDPWGDPLHQPFDGHGAWSCNNRSCTEHPQHLYDHKPGQAPGWMQAEHDPHKDLTREVGKAFHEQGMTEDAHYLLDQQHDGPSKYSSRNPYLTVEATERKRLQEMAPHEVKAFRKHQESGRKWNRQNPAHADNIIAHWNACTPHERETGMNWYKDAHHLTKHVANDTGTPMHTAAGLMSNYSPQTHWATNMLNAAKSMKTKKGLGGKGSGIFATSKQKAVAERLHAGEHYDHVLSGPKTHAFAHLIEHGGNKDPNDPKVVIDRHALSVACGKRARDIDYEMSGLGAKKRYKQVATEYHKAAQHISKHTGVKVEAHQVQAATWLCRQRLNSGEDKKMASYGKISDDAVTTWNHYAGEHHPLAMGKEPGTGYASPKDAPEDVKHSEDLMGEGHHGTLHAAVPPSNPQRKDRTGFGRTASGTYLAYGETKAPQDVDTLRDEECPVCGESDAYDGNRCDVCGFDAPPKMFQDPDLDLAKQLDLRKDIAQDEMSDPNGDGMPDVIPGSGGMGDESVPPLAEMVPDPQDVGQQQVNQILDQQGPLDPEQLDPNGQPMMAPPNSLGQDMPQDPNSVPLDPSDIAGGPPLDAAADPGTPGDAAADLVCPACGFQQGAEPPQSVDMNQSPSDVAGSKGALCPQCQQAPLMSIQDLDQMGQQMGQVPVDVRTSASLAAAFPIITL